MFRGDNKPEGGCSFHAFHGPHFQEAFSEALTNMAPVIATPLKTFKLPGDDKQHPLTTVLSSLCSMVWKSVYAEHWHSAVFKLDFFPHF